MKNTQEENKEKHLKTWDEAVNELRAFIIKSKKEEAKKAQASEDKE